MLDSAKRLRRGWKRVSRLARELRMIGKGLASTDHPILAHLIPMRRCNLSCAYCNEYDDHSKPVPIETMYQRLDRLAELGTNIITISRRRAAAASGPGPDCGAHPAQRA